MNGVDLMSLISVLGAAYGVVLGGVVLVTGWQWFGGGRQHRKRHDVVVPLGGVIGLFDGGAR